MREGIEGIAFDLDGTLYPNYRFNIKLLPFIIKEMRFLSAFGKARTIIRKEQKNASSFHNTGFYDYQAEITGKILSAPAEAIKEKIESMIYRGWEPIFKKVKLYKNVIETLNALKKEGFKLGLLSDFPPEAKLEYLGLDGIWDAVLCSERCGALKPHPLSFKELALAMGLSCEKILYVGNSRSYDVAGAAGAGMKTAWIKSPFIPGNGFKKIKSDFSFAGYRQLLRIMIR